MAKGVKLETYLKENFLKDKEQAEDYLNYALEEGDLELLQAVAGDLIESGYSSFKITGAPSSGSLDSQKLFNSLEIELKQQVLEKS